MQQARRKPCTAPGCDRVAVAKGFCHMHYKRDRAGKPLVAEELATGGPAGHGLFGVLDDDGQSVMCHVCGERLKSLGGHLLPQHDMTAREYKLEFGLPLTKPLASAATSEAQSRIAKERLQGPDWASLESARNPAAAARARDPIVLTRSGALPGRKRTAIQNGRAAQKRQIRTCPVCGTQWCPLPGGYRRKTCSEKCQHTLAASHRSRDPREPQTDTLEA